MLPAPDSRLTPGEKLRMAASSAAFGLSAWLAWRRLTGAISTLSGCGDKGGCEAALGGHWSTWLGVPVTLLAMLLHAGIIILTLPSVARRLSGRTGSQLLAAAGLIPAGAAAWFIALMQWGGRAGGWCPWCLATHALGLVAALTILVPAWRARRDLPGVLAGGALTAAAALAVLIAGQVLGPRSRTHELTATTPPTAPAAAPAAAITASVPANTRRWAGSPHAPRVVSYFGGEFTYDAANLPLLGKPDAPIVLVEYFDYTCRSCRDLYGDLKALKQRWPDRFAVVLLPCPLHRACNPFLKPGIEDHVGACELARLALAVWHHAPAAFPGFHEALMNLPLPANATEAIRIAEAIVPPPMLKQLLDSKELIDLATAITADYAKLAFQNIRMPKLLLKGELIMHGTANSTDAFLAVMSEQFRLGGTPAR